MCDSESEEFASADEDFEEIEPDELEEVLQSTKPSDVSSKKTAQPVSGKSDVEPVYKKSSSEVNVEQKDAAKSIRSDSVPCSAEISSTTVSKANNEEKIPPVEQSMTEDAPELPGDENKGAELIPNIPTDTKQPLEKKTIQNPPQTLSKLDALDASPIPPLSPSSENVPKNPNESKHTSKKLVLKPAKPQMLEKKPLHRVEDSIEKTQELSKTVPKPAEAAEGWDDFDDDWGDFSADASGVATGNGGEKKVVNANSNAPVEKLSEQPTRAKASFRDVDIDDVESKLKDFMKHKDDPPLTSVLDRLSLNEENKSTAGAGQSWGSWKPSWGGAAVSFLSNASKSVASITTNITQVIESGIGVPNPEELARRQAEEQAKLKADGYLREESVDGKGAQEGQPKPAEDRFGFDQLVSGVTQISSKVITGGLDTLEGIGKKTMTILQENDPGLLNKRKLLGLQPNDGVVLSQVLREAKAKTEERERNLKQIQKHQYKKKLHFETLFDDYHGLVHLEALEMLSKQASLKLESLMAPLTGKALEELQETMSEVKELCELPETENDDDADGLHTADELEVKFREAIVDLNPNVKVDFGEILKSWTEYTCWIEDHSTDRTGQDVFEKAMHALAQTTALCVLRMHKLAEILLISEHHSTATEADVVVQLTTVFCWHLSGVATRFCSELTKMKDESGDESDSALITNIFLELIGGGGLRGSMRTTLDSTFGGGLKLFLPTFMSMSTRASSCVLMLSRQYNLSPGFATKRWANSR
uniref:Protein FAM114A2 n=1 Tax=Anopheles dirus TaxID=7168 RepID=A0A182NSG7_9DIPT